MADDNIVLSRPENMPSRPTVCLHLLVKNGEAVLGRLLDNVGSYIDEVEAVVNDTMDSTVEELVKGAASHDLDLGFIEVTPDSHPDLYIPDFPETYQQGESLVGEVYEGPFTERMLLADWAAARNLGWIHCKSDWKLFLDADDVIEDPESIPGLCEMLGERGHDAASSEYHYRHASGQVLGGGFRERLIKNVSHIGWHGRVHEVLRGSISPVHISGSLIVVDMKDSPGAGLRIPGRDFKILYHQARTLGWESLEPRELLYMAMDSKMQMPVFAARALDLCIERSVWPEEQARACCIQGEIRETEGNFVMAESWYEKALGFFPGTKSAFRLCRARFKQGKWHEAINAYHIAMANKEVPQLLDDGPVYEDASKILVAQCFRKLGQPVQALDFCRQARQAFPSNPTLAVLEAELILEAAKA